MRKEFSMLQSSPTVGFISLGCPKNLVDSERILTQIRAEGYTLSAQYESSDLVIINTCGFIESAVEESLESIGEALAENGRVIVTGCLGARAEQIRERFPEVLAISGAHAYAEVMTALHHHLPPPHHPAGLVAPGEVRLTPRHYAYLKIAEGCSHRCSFCIIPQLRGDLVSRPLDEILLQAERLAADGVRELLVVSQDTAAYGQDLRHRPAIWQGRPLRTRLLDLATALAELGIWIRLHYLYPYKVLDELLPLMAEGAILPYLDIPLQHVQPQILRAMGRPAAAEQMLERIARWRQICPDLTLRSSFIVGFPGERDEDFAALLAFLDAAQLDRVGCFCYSNINGAAAQQFADQLPESLKQERQQQLMERQQQISFQRLQRRVGQRLLVLVDEVHAQHLITRSAAEAPEVDGVVVVNGSWELEPGDLIEVEVVGHDHHDLFAEVADPADEEE